MSVIWVIMVHTYLTIFYVADNKVMRVITERNFWYQSVGNASYCVDTFFVIRSVCYTYVYSYVVCVFFSLYCLGPVNRMASGVPEIVYRASLLRVWQYTYLERCSNLSDNDLVSNSGKNWVPNWKQKQKYNALAVEQKKTVIKYWLACCGVNVPRKRLLG